VPVFTIVWAIPTIILRSPGLARSQIDHIALGSLGSRISYGTFVPAEQEIRLHREYASGSMAVDTVLHEVIHAIFAIGTVQVEQGEEHVVSALATYLAQIIRDNADFVTWLQQTVRR
jgi:hypothetical protein